MKKYTLFAGVNGAGKTSIYKSVFYNEEYIGNIKKAKEKGFFVVMNYIGLENSEIAKERVRVQGI